MDDEDQVKKQEQPQRPLTLAEEIAQAALRGFFGDPLGFKEMDHGPNKMAAKAVMALAKQHQDRK